MESVAVFHAFINDIRMMFPCFELWEPVEDKLLVMQRRCAEMGRNGTSEWCLGGSASKC